MTPADLRAICDSLNEERGKGGLRKLARLLGWHYSTLWRKLNGKSPITQSDELALLAGFRRNSLPTEVSVRQTLKQGIVRVLLPGSGNLLIP